MRAILLGPQRRPTLDAVVRSLSFPEGPFATVTAGWQEREPDDGELRAFLGGQAAGLSLYARWLDVQERDPEYAAASAREAIAGVRSLDAAHLARVNEVRGEFFDRLRPHERPVIASHRASVAELLRSTGALVVAGGHVGVLAEVLHLFNVAAALDSPVIAWSAGAMALADRIVLFGDRSAHGPGHPEVYGSGLSVVRDVVLLPHAKARLLLDDAPRMAVFARRFAPARCLPLEAGTRVELSDSGDLPGGTRVLGSDGHVTALGEAA